MTYDAQQYLSQWILNSSEQSNCLVVVAPEGYGKTIAIQRVFQGLENMSDIERLSHPDIDHLDLRVLWSQGDHPDLATIVDRVMRHGSRTLIPPHNPRTLEDRLLRYSMKTPNGLVVVFDNIDPALENLSFREKILFIAQLMRIPFLETHGDGSENRVILLLREEFFALFHGDDLSMRCMRFAQQMKSLHPRVSIISFALEHWNRSPGHEA